MSLRLARPAFSVWIRPLTILILAPLLLSSPARAQDERVTVRVDGRALFRVGATGAVDAATRARRIEQRIATLLQTSATIPPAITSPAGISDVAITVAGVPVVTVTQADADDNLTTVDALAAQWTQALDAALQRAQERRQGLGGRFVAEVQSSVETAFGRLIEAAITIIPRVIAAALVLGLFWLMATGVRAMMRAIFRRVIDDLTVENLIKQLAYYAVWALGIIIAVYALGFDVQAVATGLGLTSLALGFALKDILSNFVSGILILTLRPFELGDQIVIGETEGSVERIVLRATEIRTYDGRTVLVPNAEVFTSRITNNTAAPIRRGSVELFVGYDSDLHVAIRVVRDATQGAEGVLAEPASSVRIRDLGQDDLVLEARFWTDSRRSDFLATSSAVREAIVAAMKTAGIGLPEPDVRILVPQHVDQWQMALGRGIDVVEEDP